MLPVLLPVDQILDMKKNRLQDCPEAIGNLSRLKRLELDGAYDIIILDHPKNLFWPSAKMLQDENLPRKINFARYPGEGYLARHNSSVVRGGSSNFINIYQSLDDPN